MTPRSWSRALFTIASFLCNSLYYLQSPLFLFIYILQDGYPNNFLKSSVLQKCLSVTVLPLAIYIKTIIAREGTEASVFREKVHVRPFLEPL